MPRRETAPQSIELAELVAKLVSDTAEGMRESIRLQEERLAEISAAMSLNEPEFAQAYVTDNDVDNDLIRLFPAAQADRRHAVMVSGPYHPATEAGTIESPPFNALLGIKLERKDYARTKRPQEFLLRPAGVKKIRDTVRAQLSARLRFTMRETLRRAPRLVVDSGTISAAINLRLENRALTSADSLDPQQNLRVLVRAVDADAPQSRQLKVDILSRLEITFKSIS